MEQHTKVRFNRLKYQGFDDNGGTPFIYEMLDELERKHYLEWFRETEERGLIGETSMPAMGILTGLIFGNRINRVVQCGHYAGYSLIMLGMLARKFNPSCRIFSIDVDQSVTRFTNGWIERLGLSDTTKTLIADSADPYAARLAREFLGGAPEFLFIDSSHQYRHTLEELDLWSREVAPGGVICMHDAAEFSTYQDANDMGGVSRALGEWLQVNDGVSCVTLQGTSSSGGIFNDPCGVAIMQILPKSRQETHQHANDTTSEKRLAPLCGFSYLDQWIAGDGWSWDGSCFSKTAGVSSSVHCFSPVVEGETYEVEVTLEDVQSGGVHVVAGGGPLGDFLSANGRQTGRVLAGGQNALLGLWASQDFVGRVSHFSARLELAACA